MTDIITPEQRKLNMQHIRGRDTKPEIYLRKLLFQKGYRYRLYSNNIPGHPDIWFAKYNTAVFVNGCFWHRHEGCRYAYMPKTRVEFWTAKFNRNIDRDRIVKSDLHERAIKRLVIWECTIKNMMKNPEIENQIISEIARFLQLEEDNKEI